MASWNERTPHDYDSTDPLGFFIGVKNGFILSCPFWLIVCIAAAILYNCK
jgi:hypothetical protein